MTDRARCPYCCSLKTTVNYLVERSYMHPVMACMLGLLTALFFALNSSNVLVAVLIGVGMTGLFLFSPVTKRVIGLGRTCKHCGRRWTRPPTTPRPHLRVVR